MIGQLDSPIQSLLDLKKGVYETLEKASGLAKEQ